MIGVGLMLVGWLVLAVLTVFALDWLRARTHRRTPEERRAHAAAFHRRLLEPDWAAVERHLGGSAPAALRALYEDTALIERTDVVVHDPRPETAASDAEWDVGHFEPAGDEQPDWPAELGLPPNAFCFAWTRSGDPYLFLPSGRLDGDGPVKLALHDGDGVLDVAPTLSEFHAWLRSSV